MKRHSGLLRLSREHHTALVLAKHARRASEELEEASFARQVAAAFGSQLEPHFRLEEECLLPLLEKAGQTAAAARTRSEHAQLRELAMELASGDIARLRRFGELLEAHVRYEEHDLFPLAESALPPEALASLDIRLGTTPSALRTAAA